MTHCVFSIHFSSFCVCALLFKVMARAMKTTKSGVLTQIQVVASVAETNGLKNKQVKGVIESLFAVACGEIK